MSKSEIAELAASEALSWLDTPYRHQASIKGVGCDCLGLVRGVWRTLYGTEPAPLPIYTPNWAETKDAGQLEDAAKCYLQAAVSPSPGSVLLFRFAPSTPVKHCGILLNSHEFVHAYWGRAVCRSSFGNWWKRRVAGAYDFPENIGS